MIATTDGAFTIEEAFLRWDVSGYDFRASVLAGEPRYRLRPGAAMPVIAIGYLERGIGHWRDWHDYGQDLCPACNLAEHVRVRRVRGV